MIRSNHVRTFLFLFPFACLGAASCAQVLGLDKYTDGVCNPGEKRTCYAGAAGTEGIGICKAGTETCEPHGQFWDKCVGSILPAASEDCDNHVDDDCNGKVNDTCGCIAGSMMACYTGTEGTEGKGICHVGMATCNADGVGYGECEGEQKPLTEDCTTPADENCDGEVNETSSGCGCTPGMSTSCYTGAAGTEDKGICKSGTKVCNNEGTAYGLCTGEITPEAAEDCATPEDDNCDGKVNEDCGCEPGTSASCYTGPAATENVGVCKSGTKVCNANGLDYGPCTGDVLPGTEDYTKPQDEDCNGFVGGETLWAHRFGDASSQIAYGVAVDSFKNVYVAGALQGVMTVGATTLFSSGLLDIFLAKLDGSGTPLWAKAYGSGSQYAQAVAADANGNVAIAGPSVGGIPVSFGCPTDAPPSWIAVLDPAGNCAATMGCTGDLIPYAVAFDPDHNIIVVGSHNSGFTCGSNTIASADMQNIFVAKFAPDGTNLWVRSYGDHTVPSSKQEAYAVAVDGGGNVTVTGVMYGTVDFLTGLVLTDTNGDGSMFLLRLNKNGSANWNKAFPSSQGNGVAVTSTGEIVVTGTLSGSADFGGGTLATAGMGDVFVVKYGASGNHIWSKRFGDASAQGGAAVAIDSQGRISVTGTLGTSVDFGGGVLSSSGGMDAFVANLDSAGSHRWSRAYGAAGATAGTLSCAVGPAGEVHLSGVLSGTINFGTGPLTSAGAFDALAMKIAP